MVFFDRDCIPIVTGYALVTGVLIGALKFARVLHVITRMLYKFILKSSNLIIHTSVYMHRNIQLCSTSTLSRFLCVDILVIVDDSSQSETTHIIGIDMFERVANYSYNPLHIAMGLPSYFGIRVHFL